MSKNNYPYLPFSVNDPLQDCFFDVNGDCYGVARLVDMSKDLLIFDCPLAALNLSTKIWEGNNIFDLAFHVKKINDADLSKPIILAWDGTIADGRHRIIKAIADGKNTIKAVRITWKPTPCRYAPNAET